MERKIEKKVTGYKTMDGAGVHLVRVLGPKTVMEYDPILMLDSFDSENPEDYTAGFPLHPHRGIETISYVYKGKMTHRDSLGNEDTISDGEVQWMTAGSGILHEERLPASERMLGVQLWLNLPAKDKMVPPAYHAVKNKDIVEIPLEGGFLRLLAGEFQGRQGYMGSYLPLDYYDIHIMEGETVGIPVLPERSVMLFTLKGDALVAGSHVAEKTGVRLSAGDFVSIGAASAEVQVLFISSVHLGEPVAWGGPIVMNTNEELAQAFHDLDHGNFLKQGISY